MSSLAGNGPQFLRLTVTLILNPQLQFLAEEGVSDLLFPNFFVPGVSQEGYGYVHRIRAILLGLGVGSDRVRVRDA